MSFSQSFLIVLISWVRLPILSTAWTFKFIFWFSLSPVSRSYKLTLSLYSALMILQLWMEGSVSWGMLMTFVTFSLAEEGMGSPTSFKRSLVWTLLLPCAKKLCFLYTQYLGLISRDDLFWMQARTFNPSPAKQARKVKTTLGMWLKTVNMTLKALTLEKPTFFKIYIHGYCSWGEAFYLLILRLVLWCLNDAQNN